MPPFPYSVRPELLPEELRTVWGIGAPDPALRAFLEDCQNNPHTTREMWLLSLLEQFVPSYTAHGILGMYPMHLLGPDQWAQMIPEHLQNGTLLDVGAGQGFVTEHARTLFSHITATETAKSMVRRLQERGFEAHAVDITSTPEIFPKSSFDVVSILNVLDRCKRPRTLLTNALNFLKDDGVIIISVPLPISQCVRGLLHTTKESIGGTSDSWEASLTNFYQETIAPLGLTPILITRLPYIYKNSVTDLYVILDDFVLVCKK